MFRVWWQWKWSMIFLEIEAGVLARSESLQVDQGPSIDVCVCACWLEFVQQEMFWTINKANVHVIN